jgi:3',5'-cyclic AMP phosphodiesterase CpdA
MIRTLTLAHLSDVHLPPLPLPSLRHWNVKRTLGLLNWHRLRRHQHLLETLAAIVSDVRRQAPDQIAVTGDLVNIGLPAEYEAASAWLDGLGPPSQVTVIPGNHDIYVDMGSDPGIGRWASYMAPSGPKGPPAEADRPVFPFVRRVGRVALIGLNSALPTPPFQAFGRLGTDQLASLAAVLERLGAERLVRVVMIHHPPLPGQAPPRCALQDACALEEVLRHHGAELVLHGHNHRAMAALVDAPSRPVPVIGVPSASLGRASGHQSLARYNLYRIAPDPQSPIELIERGLDGPGGNIVELSRRRLDAGMPAIA